MRFGTSSGDKATVDGLGYGRSWPDFWISPSFLRLEAPNMGGLGVPQTDAPALKKNTHTWSPVRLRTHEFWSTWYYSTRCTTTPGTLQTSGFLGTRYETVEKVGPAIAGHACKHKFEVGERRITARVPVGYRIGTGSVPVLDDSSRISIRDTFGCIV